jgi:uroporphyrinogen decarboxylase
MTALDGGKPDRVPVMPFTRDWAVSQAGFTFSEVLKNPGKYVYAQYRALRELQADVIWDLMGVHAESEAMGSVLKLQNDAPPSVVEFFVKELSQDLARIRLPNPYKDGRLPELLQVVRRLKELVGGEVPVIAYVQGPFRHAAMLRGTERLLKDMFKSSDKCQELLTIATDSLIIYGTALVDAGADLIMIAEPYLSADMMSKNLALEVESHFTRLARTLKKTGVKVFLHLCGEFNDRFDMIKRIGTHGVSLDEKNDLARAREIIGPETCLIGNVNPSGTLFGGTPEMVADEARRAIDKAGRDGAFILASGCLVPKGSPLQNLEALIQVAKEAGY